jgi:hypothetical protein
MFQLSAEEYLILRSQTGTSYPAAAADAPRLVPSPSKAWQCCRVFWAVRAPLH